MKPKRKRYIDILGTRVKIKYVSKDMYDDHDNLLHGAFCGESMTIHISTKSDIQSTLFHEACHAAVYLSGTVNLINAKTEEALISAIEGALGKYFHF